MMGDSRFGDMGVPALKMGIWAVSAGWLELSGKPAMMQCRSPENHEADLC